MFMAATVYECVNYKLLSSCPKENGLLYDRYLCCEKCYTDAVEDVCFAEDVNVPIVLAAGCCFTFV